MHVAWFSPLGVLLALSAARHPSTAAAKNEVESRQAPPAAEANVPDACARYAEDFCAAVGGEGADECGAMRSAVRFLPARACRIAAGEIGAVAQRLEELRASCRELERRLCADVGEDGEGCRVVREQTPRFSPDRCRTMLDRYDDVLRELQRIDARYRPLPAETWERVLDGAPPAYGPASAKVVLVVFTDYLCPFCQSASAAMQPIRERYGSVVRFVVRQFPLNSHGSTARLAAQAVLAANAQGKFWELSELLFAEQDRLREEGRSAIEALAEQVGIEMRAFRRALDEGTFDAQVEADLALGAQVLLDGTPTFLINGKLTPINPRSSDAFAEALDAALTAAGVPIPAAATNSH